MRTLRSWRGLLGTLALAGPPALAVAQPVGSEFQVNTYTTANQVTGSDRLVAADASGNFVVVWASRNQDGSGFGIFGQRYDSAGGELGNEFRVNSFTASHQSDPAVAADATGNFVVVWQSVGQDGSGLGIFGQRYDSGGVALGAEFRANSYTSSNQQRPSVASDPSGNFVVVWQSYLQDGGSDGIFGQRYDSGGAARGGEFRVNSYTTLREESPSVASDASGNFVVLWSGYRIGSSYDIFGQRFDSAGGVLESEFRVNSFTLSPQRIPSVTSDAIGSFVVVWSGVGQVDQSGIFGQRYDSGGVPQGNNFQVNSYTTSLQSSPSVASDLLGNFVVVWNSYTQDGSGYGVFGQRYDSAGVAQGLEFRINSYTSNAQSAPSAVAIGIDEFFVAWQSQGQDGDVSGVFGQRYAFGGASTIHAGDLDRRAKNVGASWRAQVKSLVHDDGHGPVSGALVTLDVSGVGTRTCTTTAAGNCEVSVVVSDSVPSLTFTVMSLSKAGFSYDAGANHDPDADSNGTAIVVNQP